MKKFIIFILLLFPFISQADFMENTLDFDSRAYNIEFSFYKLKNPNLKNEVYQKQFLKLQKFNPLIQKAIIKQYKNHKFNYYQTQGIIKNYNYFLYYINAYFESLKNKEIYGDSKETRRNIYNNLIQARTFYKRFKFLVNQK